MRLWHVVTLLTLLSQPLMAQRRQCLFRLDYSGRSRQLVIGADTNYFAGGGVILSCVYPEAAARDSPAFTLASDSLAFTGPQGRKTAQFVGRVKYTDSTVSMTAERGTYFVQGERWEARGKVHTLNSATGSTLDGPALDYYRELPGQRDTVEFYAAGRPTISYATRDSAGQPAEPYQIVGDRVRMKGDDRIWAGGRVTIDRSDFHAQGDSLWLDTGVESRGSLIGTPLMRGLGADSFALTGVRIDLALDQQELTYVTALGDGHATSREIDLVADTIGLDIEARQLEQTIAWGKTVRPKALAGSYEVRADSVAFDTPNRLLREVRAFGQAWLAGAIHPDGDRDWLSGDSVTATFTTWDSAGTTRSTVERIDSRGSARSYYQVTDRGGATDHVSLSYSRGDRIVVQMRSGGDRGVETVDVRGAADGVYLEPVAQVDTAAVADSLRRRGRP